MEVVGGGDALTITNAEPCRLHPVLQTCALIGLCLEVQTAPAEDKCGKGPRKQELSWPYFTAEYSHDLRPNAALGK